MSNLKTIERVLEYIGGIDSIDIDPEPLREALEMCSLHHKLNEFIDMHHAGRGLTPRQAEIMQVLFHNEDCVVTPAELADEVGLTRSAMTSALDSLEKDNRIVRNPHPNDRRMLAISLSPDAKEFMRQFLLDRYSRMSRVSQGLTKNERQQLLFLYQKLYGLLCADFQENGQ